MTLSGLEMRDAKGQLFTPDLVIRLVPFETKLDTVTQVGEGRFSRGLPRPIS